MRGKFFCGLLVNIRIPRFMKSGFECEVQLQSMKALLMFVRYRSFVSPVGKLDLGFGWPHKADCITGETFYKIVETKHFRRQTIFYW